MKYALIGALVLASAIGAQPAAAQGGKPVIAVAEFKNETNAGWWSGGVGWELSGMLSNELVSTGDFKVVERTQIESVLAEQNMAASGRISPGTGAQIGKLTGAQYLIAGTVTSFEENTASTGGGISYGGISLGGNKSEAYLAVDLRVINATTGEIDYVRTIEGRSKGGGVSIGVFRGGFGGALSNQKNTPVGKAIRAALVEITDYLSCVMVQRGGCEAEFEAKEARRRQSTRDALDLD
ncbi:MAG TPA: CsgG/HfaB family protein [Pseudomonadota bacterium]|nr:CsgG/HfaB family protein [Xanthomonadales bacterium]MBP7419099.1 CsgG/HfaB family protein [Xanthomonadales bacterium]HQX23457.1 CsgG/HfaB family protein [Pseudomonadota bacterium]HQY36042.1 CsgG/HfaB family protein [Pseudomonadota bacterium]HRA36113.1 CsgG/HfaB family protein [Pseudomonadota bacterium]